MHRRLGPGLLETVYEVILACKLGYLLNFGEDVVKTDITRCANGLEEYVLSASEPLRENQN